MARSGTFSGANFQGGPATGAPFELHGAALIQVACVKITSIHRYCDTAEFAAAVDLMPSRHSVTTGP
jgi:hypothetical protein